MSPSGYRPEFTLTSKERDLLEGLVSCIEEHVRATLRASCYVNRITALALFIPQGENPDEPAFFPDAVTGLSPERRGELMGIGDPNDRWDELWNAGAWDLIYWPSGRTAAPGVGERLIDRVLMEHPEQNELQFISPEEWVLQMVCRRLAYKPPPQADPELFTCILSEGWYDDWLETVLAYATPPAVSAELNRQGVLRPPPGY